MTSPAETIRAIAAAHNLDPQDILSDVHADRPEIDEDALSAKVLDFVRAKNFTAAAAAIELEVRIAHQCEGAA